MDAPQATDCVHCSSSFSRTAPHNAPNKVQMPWQYNVHHHSPLTCLSRLTSSHSVSVSLPLRTIHSSPRRGFANPLPCFLPVPSCAWKASKNGDSGRNWFLSTSPSRSTSQCAARASSQYLHRGRYEGYAHPCAGALPTRSRPYPRSREERDRASARKQVV